MKRGLVVLDENETPRSEFEGRVARLQADLKSRGLACAFIYGDVSRSSDIAYLSNICIYWNEGILAVPQSGKPFFITKLSKRVHPWMRRTSIIEDIETCPDLATGVIRSIEVIRGRGTRGACGIVDIGLWPYAVVEAIEQSVGVEYMENLADWVRQIRMEPSASERRLLETANLILRRAVKKAARTRCASAAKEQVQRAVRAAGFLDVFVHCNQLEDGTFSVDAVGQYRHLWLRCAISEGGAKGQQVSARVSGLLGYADRPNDDQPASEVDRDVNKASDISVELVSHADLENEGIFAGTAPSRTSDVGGQGVVAVIAQLSDRGGVARCCEMAYANRDVLECLTHEV